MKKKQKIRWIVCFALDKKCCYGDVKAFETRKEAKDYIHKLHKRIGGFEDDHHILKVLITP